MCAFEHNANDGDIPHTRTHKLTGLHRPRAFLLAFFLADFWNYLSTAPFPYTGSVVVVMLELVWWTTAWHHQQQQPAVLCLSVFLFAFLFLRLRRHSRTYILGDLLLAAVANLPACSFTLQKELLSEHFPANLRVCMCLCCKHIYWCCNCSLSQTTSLPRLTVDVNTFHLFRLFKMQTDGSTTLQCIWGKLAWLVILLQLTKIASHKSQTHKCAQRQSKRQPIFCRATMPTALWPLNGLSDASLH